MAVLSTFISLPVSIPLGTVSLDGASVSGVATTLTKKYQKKLTKITKLFGILTSALAVFKTRISKVLNNGRADEREFTTCQTFHLEALNNLSKVEHKMEAKTRTQLQKSLQDEINDLKKDVRKSNAS